MPKTKKVVPEASTASRLANRVVAYNLALARAIQGWTQEEAAERLEAHLGQRWSKASWSAAERAVEGVRVRQFAANEIVAFSETFGLPIAWWFLPPSEEVAALIAAPDDVTTVAGDYLSVHIGSDEMLRPYLSRVEEMLEAVGGLPDLSNLVLRTALSRIVDAQARERFDDFRGMLQALLAAFETVAPPRDEGSK